MQRICVALATVLTLLAPTTSDGEDWPHWRGPLRNGTTSETSGYAKGAWISDKPIWQANVGAGASSPIVVGNQVILLGYSNGKEILRSLNAATGVEQWSVNYKCPEYARHHMGDEAQYGGPSSTPEFDLKTGFVYSLGTDGHLHCWDTRANGRLVWGRNLYDDYKVERRPKLTRAPQRDYGYTSSPTVIGDWVIVEVGSTIHGTLIAFDKRTGKEAWRSELKDEAGHTGGMAPMTIQGVACVAVITQRNLAVVRLDLEHLGKTIAVFPWVTDFANSVAGPAVQGDCVLITAAYNHGVICKVKFTLSDTKELWRQKYPSKVCTPVIHKGNIYVAWQKIRCLNWDTGELKWEGCVIGDAGSCIATSDDRVVVYGQNGKLVLMESAARSGGKYVELAVKDNIFRATAWPHVAIAGGRIYCRDREGNVACFDAGPKQGR